MLVPGDILIMWGKVTNKQEKGGMGLVDLEIGMTTQDGIESMPGSSHRGASTERRAGDTLSLRSPGGLSDYLTTRDNAESVKNLIPNTSLSVLRGEF